MDTLESMKVFARVAQRTSFSAAARDLGLSPATVTKHVAALEERLGSRLFDRTTRSVSLTEAGRVYLERCLECLQAVEDADNSVTELAKRPKGLLRVTAPFDLQRHLPAVVARFLRAHPGVSVDLRLSNRVVDLVAEGVDLAIRVAPALDGSYVARSLGSAQLVVLASPLYLNERGRPKRPEDLRRHDNVLFAEPQPMNSVLFERAGRRVTVELPSVMLTNGGEIIRGVLLDHAGVALVPSFLVGDDVRLGRLERVLPDWRVLPPLGLFAVYPHRRFVAPKVRAFVELLREAWGDSSRDPWWGPAAAPPAPAPKARPHRRRPRGS